MRKPVFCSRKSPNRKTGPCEHAEGLEISRHTTEVMNNEYYVCGWLRG